MTTAEMVTRLNSLLNQTATTSTHWTTNMYYEALSAGQRAVVSFVNKNNPNSPLLKPFLKTDSVTSTYFKALPDDFQDINVAQYAYDGTTFKKAREKTFKEYLELIENPYLTPSKNAPIVYIRGGTAQGGYYYFYPTNSTTSNGILMYISLPPAIDGSTEPVVKDNAHEAVVMYALFTLRKREKDSEKLADIAFQSYQNLASML